MQGAGMQVQDAGRQGHRCRMHMQGCRYRDAGMQRYRRRMQGTGMQGAGTERAPFPGRASYEPAKATAAPAGGKGSVAKSITSHEKNT